MTKKSHAEEAAEKHPGAVIGGTIGHGNPPQPTIGRIVHYRLTADDAARIMQWRADSANNRGQVHKGTVAHVGSPVGEGDVVPMIITHPDNGGAVNGHCLLDGSDSFWVRGVEQGDDPGQWNWPPRI